MPDSSPARIVSIKVVGSSLPPCSAKLAARDRPASTSFAIFISIFFSGLSVVLSAMRWTVRAMGMPARRMMENWLHITVKALLLSLEPPISMFRRPGLSGSISLSFSTMLHVCLIWSTASSSSNPSTMPETFSPSLEMAVYL